MSMKREKLEITPFVFQCITQEFESNNNFIVNFEHIHTTF